MLRLQQLQLGTCQTGNSGSSSSSIRRVHTTPNTMTNLAMPSTPGPSECLICSELALLVLFAPCQHSVACEGKTTCIYIMMEPKFLCHISYFNLVLFISSCHGHYCTPVYILLVTIKTFVSVLD